MGANRESETFAGPLQFWKEYNFNKERNILNINIQN
jgi:hypothetical protein